MSAEWDYKTLHDITNPAYSRIDYLAGEGIMQQVVDDLGLVVGVDVVPARPDILPLPARNAKRSTWALYALSQPDASPDEIDGMTRDQLSDRYTVDSSSNAATAESANLTDWND